MNNAVDFSFIHNFIQHKNHAKYNIVLNYNIMECIKYSHTKAIYMYKKKLQTTVGMHCTIKILKNIN